MIHPTAIIEDGAIIADGVNIGPFCQIGASVELKSGVSIASHTTLHGKIVIHEDVKIFSHVAMGHTNSDIEVQSKTHIREFVQISTNEDESAAVTIGHEVFIMAYVQLEAGVSIGDRAILTNAVILRKDVECDEKVIVGGLSSIDEGLHIGTGVMIGGASHIKTSMPPFSLVEGNPASIKGLNTIGLRRRFENIDDIDAIKNAYKSIYKNGVDINAASKIVEKNSNINGVTFAKFVVENSTK